MFAKLAFVLVLGLAFENVYADEPDSIVGGFDASPGEFPYQVSLRNRGYHTCGGSIVSERHIVTAAHCVSHIVDGPLDGFQVVSGADKLDSRQGQYHKVKSIRIHPGYIPEASHSWVNDAAVITLAEPMKFNANQKPIPLATSDTADPPLRAPLTFSGWGELRANGPVPNNLQKATFYYIDNEHCQRLYRNQPIYRTHICGLQNPGIGACSGDSGGPLVYKGKLIGIASWVVLCARGYPDVFTKVAEYESFFASAMRD